MVVYGSVLGLNLCARSVCVSELYLCPATSPFFVGMGFVMVKVLLAINLRTMEGWCSHSFDRRGNCMNYSH